MDSVSLAATDVVGSLESGNILVSTAPLWRPAELVDTPRANLPLKVDHDELDRAMQSARPAPVLVFDEETGEFVEVTRDGMKAGQGLPLARYDEAGDDVGDWVVYTSTEARPALPTDNGNRQTAAVGPMLIDWDAEANDINFLIPPLVPGRTGMNASTRREDGDVLPD